MTTNERAGLRRFPVLTAVVLGVTLAANVTQFAVHGTLDRIERAPSGLHGDWWRTFTALFGQDGGVAGTVSNLIFLVAVGVLAEQVVSRPRWLLACFGAGLVGEFAGYAWQPYGAGDSVAICGLAGVVAVALWRGERLPAYAPMVLLLWCGALLAGLWPPLIGLGIVACAAVRIAAGRGLPVGRPAAVAALATGVALVAVRDIHGAALLAGLAFASAEAAGRTVGPVERRRPGVRA
jgi:membrane associated rhomboid family serine protease